MEMVHCAPMLAAESLPPCILDGPADVAKMRPRKFEQRYSCVCVLHRDRS